MAKKSDKAKKEKKLKGLTWVDRFDIRREKLNFLENLNMLLSSGMGVDKALGATTRETTSKPMLKVIKMLESKVDSGSTMWEALSDTGIYDPYVISLIRVGEESGRLNENLKVVVDQQHKNDLFQAKIKSAMLYPAVVVVIGIVISIGVAWFILPNLVQIFDQLKVDLPVLTRILIGISDFMQAFGYIFVPVFIISLIYLFYFLFIKKETKHIGQELILRIPILKRLTMDIEIARSGYVLGTLLDAGLPIVDAIRSLSEATAIRRYRKFYVFLKGHISDGNTFEASFKKYKDIEKVFPMPVQQMIISGEESGMLPDTLRFIGENYEVKTDMNTKNLAIVLEPLILLVVWVGVAFVALAIIMPIYSLVGKFDTSSAVTRTDNQENNSFVTESSSVETDLLDDDGNMINPILDSIGEEEDVPEEVEEVVPEIEEPTGLGNMRISSAAGFANVRDGASTGASILTTVPDGGEYKYFSVESNWYEIEYVEGKLGWIFGDLVEILE